MLEILEFEIKRAIRMCKGNLQFKSSSISEYCISKQSSKGIKVENTWKDIKCTTEKRVISKKQYCKLRSDYSFVLMTLFAFFCWNHLRNIDKNTKKRKGCTLNTSAQLKPKFVSILRNIKLPWMQSKRKYILVDANFTLT